MAPRSTGSAVLWFGEVSLPVRVYPATREPPKVEFRTLHRACGSRIEQRYRCPKDGTILERDELAKGYEVGKDRYVLLEEEELDRLSPEPDPEIRILGLVGLEAVDPVHYAKACYLGPDAGTGPIVDGEIARRYSWAAEVLRLSGRMAIGRWATRGRDVLVGVRASAGRLIMTELRRAEELRDASEIAVPPTTTAEPEITWGLRLVEALELPAFDPAAYPDERYAAMLLALQAKVDGREIVASPPPGRPAPPVDLLEALRASIKAARAGKEEGKARPSNRKRATR